MSGKAQTRNTWASANPVKSRPACVPVPRPVHALALLYRQFYSRPRGSAESADAWHLHHPQQEVYSSLCSRLFWTPLVLTRKFAGSRPASLCKFGVQDLAHFPDQRIFCEWFMEKNHASLKHSMARDEAVGISRNIQDPHAGLLRQQSLRENSSIHSWHHHISQQKVDFPRMLGFHLDSLVPVLSNEHPEAVGLEERLCQLSKRFSVLDKQDRF